MSNSPSISIIIPVLNEEANIECAVVAACAIADQTIVVDGGSSDSTVRILEQLECELVHGPKGRGQQLYAGAEEASGDILLFLHADTLLDSSARTQILECWRATGVEERGKFYGCFQQRIKSSAWIFRLIEKGNYWRARFQKLPYGDQAVFLSRTLYDRVGGMPQIPLMEDFEFACKLAALAPLKILPGPVSVDARRWEKVGPIRQTIRNWTIATRYRFGASPKALREDY